MDLKTARAKHEEMLPTLYEFRNKLDENGCFADSETEANWEKFNNDLNELEAHIDRLERGEGVLARIKELEARGRETKPNVVDGRPVLTDDNPIANMPASKVESLAFRAYLKRAQGFGDGLTPQEEAASAFYRGERRGPNGREFAFKLPTASDIARFKNAALVTTSGSNEGGNLVSAETLRDMIEVNMLAFGGIRQVATTYVTSGGEPFVIPTMDDTGNTGRLLAESTAADDNAGGGSSGDGGPNPNFNKVTWNAYKYTSDTVLAPYELLQDEEFDLRSLLGSALGERLGRITAAQFATGTGSSQPSGIAYSPTAGVTAASQTDFTADEVIDLIHSIDPAYRNGPGVGFMMHDNVLAKVRKLKASTGEYLLDQRGLNGRLSSTILGYPVTVYQQMEGTLSGGGDVAMVFGDLSKYVIRRAGEMRMYVLEERYREKDQTGFVAFVREDGGLLDSGTTPVKSLTMAA